MLILLCRVRAHDGVGDDVDDLVVASAASCGAVGGVLYVVKGLYNGIKACARADSIKNIEIAYVVALANYVVFV